MYEFYMTGLKKLRILGFQDSFLGPKDKLTIVLLIQNQVKRDIEAPANIFPIMIAIK